MNKVLFHSLTIPPDNVSTGQLVADIAVELQLEGKQMSLKYDLHGFFEVSALRNQQVQIYLRIII